MIEGQIDWRRVAEIAHFTYQLSERAEVSYLELLMCAKEQEV